MKVLDQIGKAEKEKTIDEGGLTLLLSVDEMRLYMTYSPRVSKGTPSLEDVYALAKTLGVISDVMDSVVEHHINNEEKFNRILIAEGSPPKNGFDAKILYEFDFLSEGESHQLRSKLIDRTHSSGKIQIRKGELIAQKLPASKGLPGKTLTGKKMEFQPEDIPLPSGRNTLISADGLTLTAAKSGLISFDNDLVHIEDTYTVYGDVDFNTGNIDFLGNIKIKGDVRPGFIVEADGDIEISGCAESARLISRKGSIRVLHGILGKNKSKIIVAKDLEAGFIQDANITVGNNVIAGRYILNSVLNAEGCIRVLDSEGTIRGGKISSKESIRAKIAGSTNRIPTQLKVGRSLDGAALQRVLGLDKQLRDLSQKMKANEKRIQFFKLLSERVDNLPIDKKSDMELLIHANEEIIAELERMEEEKNGLLANSMSKNVENKIEIVSKVFPGVIINIDTEEYLVQQELLGSVFKLEEGSITVERRT
ncbi:MAG: DUF342 domain-containing protein [Candidatus Marinimicrobia bacterium]|nr:DUF342 domain-containing protein [Candidatus Neomarinimicrobiota bacterium]